MANIRVDSAVTIFDGLTLTFKSPADCSQVTGLVVYYPQGEATLSKVFKFTDANGNDVGNINNLFAANAIVKVVLDVDDAKAYVQNADTNAYLEGKFNNIEHDLGSGAHIVYNAGAENRVRIKVKSLPYFETGPDTVDTSLVFGNTADTSYTIYDNIANSSESYHAGRYSYGVYNKYYAYKVDNVTKTAELLCDLSSYVGTNSNGKSKDRIIAVDDDYVYFATHLSCGYASSSDDSSGNTYGTIYKFDHSGNLLSSYTDDAVTTGSYKRAWDVSVDGRRQSLFYQSTYFALRQSKDYIVIRHAGSTTYTNGARHYTYCAISKKALKYVGKIAEFSDSKTGYPPFHVVGNLLYGQHGANYSENDYAAMTVWRLTDSAAPAVIISNTSTGNTFIESTLGAMYCRRMEIISGNNGKVYYRLYLYVGAYDGSSSSCSKMYTVVTGDHINFSTGKITVNYVTSSTIPFDKNNAYDIVQDKFYRFGVPYSVYPAYEPPASPLPTLNSAFTLATVPIVDGYVHTVGSDGTIYKDKLRDFYEIERMEAATL